MTFIRQRIWIILSVVLILVYLAPLYILGTGAHVRVHDQLDSTVVWYKILANSGKIFAPNSATIPNLMNGVPRVSLGSEFKLWLWLFVWFPPFVAYTINAFLLRFVAFIGMYLLLSKHILKSKQDQFIKAGAALCFALIPYWLPGCLSVAGLPLAAYIFLNFRKREARVKDWVLLILLPFASSFILTFFFFLAAVGILWLVDWIKSKRSNWPMFSAIAVMTAVYLAKDYRLVLSVLLGQGFVSQRTSFNKGYATFASTLKNFLTNFTKGQEHVYTLQYYVIIYVAGFFFLWIILKQILRLRSRKFSLERNEKLLVRLIILTACFSMWYGLWYWHGFRVIKNTFPFTKEFNFSRIFFLNPMLWYVIFAICLKLITTKWARFGKPIVVILLAAQILVVFGHNHEIKYRRYHMPSWRQFYSPKLFHHIQTYIGKDPSTYRVVSIGIHPSISQYNGFYTLDFYLTLYPLAYKHKFRRIIAPELAKNKTLAHYYDNWGSRCYVFVDELGKNYFYYKSKHKVIDHLDLNMKAFKKMGGQYILSAVKIANAGENHMKLLHVFANNVSVWRIYLYKVSSSK